MNLRHLSYLIALAREGHFGRAAESVHVSQPALSAAINQLERELGVPLVTRHWFTMPGSTFTAVNSENRTLNLEP